jgi:hypothetical protein
MRKLVSLFALLAIEIVALTVLSWPSLMSFRSFAFQDCGTNFTVQYLLSTGLRPNIDFGYPYGLVPLLFGRWWFAIAGATPIGYIAASLFCNLLIAWAVARLAAGLEMRGVALVLLFVAMPYAVSLAYGNFAHGLEAVLLASALAEQGSRRPSAALPLTGAACFVKPSLSYVYGLLLVIMSLWKLQSAGTLTPRAALRFLVPAAITVAALFLLLSLAYRTDSALMTLLPLAGTANYRALHYGFFTGDGRLFWWPHDARWAYYGATVAGFWLVGTVWLIIVASFPVVRVLRGVGTIRDEIVATCALLHFAFITLMFGSRWSWPFYSYLLVIGVAVSTAYCTRPALRIPVWALVLLALSGHTLGLRDTYDSYKIRTTHTSSFDTAGLIANDELRAEWNRAKQTSQGHHAAVVAAMGEASLMFPEFSKPVAAFLMPGITLPNEAAREAQQLSKADVLVVWQAPPLIKGADPLDVDDLRRALGGADKVWAGQYFAVYRRNASSKESLPEAAEVAQKEKITPAL